VDFNLLTEDSQTNNKNYVCLTYDLSTNIVTENTPAKLSADGLTARCTLNKGPSSLYLDTTCLYIDKSYCLYSTPFFEDEGLNAGGISGIVTGSVALAMILGGGAFFLIKHLINFKIYQQKSLKYA